MALPLMEVSVGQFRCETCGRDGLTTGGVCLRCVPTVDGAPAQYRDVRAVPVAYETATTWACTGPLTHEDGSKCMPLPPDEQDEPESPGPGWEPFAGGVACGMLFTRWRRVVR